MLRSLGLSHSCCVYVCVQMTQSCIVKLDITLLSKKRLSTMPTAEVPLNLIRSAADLRVDGIVTTVLVVSLVVAFMSVASLMAFGYKSFSTADLRPTDFWACVLLTGITAVEIFVPFALRKTVLGDEVWSCFLALTLAWIYITYRCAKKAFLW